MMKHFNRETAEKRAETLKALGHPIRLCIMDLLQDGERNVGDLAELLDIKSAIASQQLKLLRLSGLVSVEKRDGHSYYTIAHPNVPRLLDCLRTCDEMIK